MRKIFLFLCAVFLSSISLNAATITSDGTARLYFNMSAVDWWIAGTGGNGNFGYFFNNSTGKNAWSTHAVKHSGNTYYLVIPKGTWANVILTRNNTSTSPSWDNKWNQTGDIILSSTSNYISKFSEGSASVTWGTAVKPVSTASATADPATIFVNAQSTLTSALTSNDDINTIISTSYSVSPETGSLTDGKFTATAAGEYTVTATITYYPNGYTSLTSTATATTTITVKELPTYTVTVNAGEGGTVTEGGIVTEGSSINITATPAENYEFNGWTITTGEGTFDNENAVSTTFSPTSDATIQANFRSTATYALKVIAGANIASAEGNVDPVTLGESYDITATPVVGYTFVGWTAEPTENATFATQESTTQVTVLNGSVNVTATATETMSALTTANSFDQDTPPAEVPTATATEIGIVTTAEVTATDVTGYTFVGWELTNCVSDDELTAKTIAVKSNGDGAAATATAKYEIIKLTYTVTVPEGTEKCYIAGDMNTWTFTEMENQGNNVFTLTIIGATKEHGYKYACGNEWKYVEKTADGNEVSNRSYTANDKVLAWNDPLATNLYLRGEMNEWGTTDRFKKEAEEAATAIVIVALKANTTYEFKVASADWSEGYSSTTAFTATSTQTLSTDVQDNAKLTTVAAGDYTFTWDLTTKKLTVTYPELPKYTVTATAENGTIEGIENEGVYTQGATIRLTATANDHYVFVNWTKGEEVVAETAEYTFTVEADVELVANFRHVASTINAHPNDGENGVLAWFISQAHAGDTVILADGEYIQEGSLTFDKPGLVIMAAENAKPVIKSGSYAQHYATTTIIGVTFDGKFSEEKQAEHGIYSYENTSKNLTLINCEFRNYEQYLLTCSSSAHVDSLVIDGCLLHDCGDAAVYYQETDLENNVPTCSYFKMTNSTVYNINGTQYYAAIDIRENSAAYGQGGNKVIIDHVTIYNYATPLGAIRVYKSPDLAITNSIISNPTAVNYSLYIYGGTVDNTLYFNGAADSRGQYTNCLNVDPLFVDADNGNFALMPLSPARGKGTDGSDLGDPRWYTSVTKYTVTATASPAEAGTVTGAGDYTEGVEVTLVATPAHGYNFVNWTKGEEVVAETAEYTFTASANVELVANFEEKAFTGNIINVEPGEGTLATAVENAEAGDKLVLADGTYTQEYSINMDKAGLIITAAENAKPVIQLTGEWTTLNVSASTTFEGITFDANNVAKYIIATLDSVAMTTDLVIYNCEFKNWTLWAVSNQYANNVSVRSVVIDNCLFHDATGAAISFSNYAPEGKQACEYFEMTNSTLYKISESSYRGIINVGSNPEAEGDYNTVVIDHITMYDYTLINSGIAAIAIRKTHNLRISNSIIANPEDNGYTALNVYGGTVDNTIHYNGAKRSGSTVYTNCYNTDPMFTNAEHGIFCLQEGSPAIGAATDGSNLGDPRWVLKPVVTHTVTATAENGTVTGAGTYNHGEEVTLTATPAFDYQFVKWSNESTENPLTITVEDNIELQAIFAEVAATTVAESGVFSISAHKTATFATGNLQYNVGTQTWRFAKQQYQVVGEQNINLGDPAFTGWIDMLGWSTNDEGNNFGVNPNNVNELYDGEFVDWGTKMGEGWSTLSAEEWSYLLNTRENAASLKQIAKVDTILGILLFPDGWVMPEDVVVEAEMDEYFEVNIYNYTLEQWTKLEQAGALFLPAAGRRAGGYGNMINYDQVEETNPENLNGGFYRHQDNTNIYCYYWTSTINAESKVSYLHNVLALGNDEYTIGNGAIWSEKGRYGQSVRLAKVAYDKHTVTATAENGTVEGAGEYTHGTEITLTATPAFDYQFVKWSNESTENPLTITVEDNIELQAIFAEVAATTVAESGVFSISAHKTATFATGNLQYNVGTDTWRFAKQQYQVVGEQNINLGDPAFTGWIDMLGWSNGEANNYGVNPSNKNEYYAGEFVDWGTKMGEGWSTLSAEEWSYLLNTRENAASLKQTAKVDTMIGLLLFPDGWVMPEDVVVEAEMDEYFEVNIYNYTLEQWTKLEQAGALFLPAAGRRAGGYGNMINYDQVEETNPENLNGGYYRHQDNTNIYCYYWTSTINAESKVSYLHNVLALGNDEYTIGNGAIWSEKGRYGQSVRLAKVAYDKHTVNATAENGGTVEGAGEYTHGTEVTLTATPANEHYVFVNWTKGEEVVAETAEYTFTVEADVELVANFKLDSHTITATAENGTVEGAGTYEHGAEVILTATAEEGYEFVKWSNESTENPLTITVTEDVTISAIFEVIPAITYTVKWYTAVGTSEDATLEEGATITKPATDPEMEGYVFKGWTDECFVAEDGSDFTAIEEFGTADADKEYYAVFAVETTTDGGVTETLTGSSLSYAGNNGYVDFTATTTSGTWSGKACYNTNNYIQINKNKNNYHIGSPTFAANIKSIKITTTNNTASSRKFYICSSNSTAQPSSGDLGSHTTTASNEQFTIELTSDVKQFYIYSSGAVYISQIDVTLSGEPTTTYSNYMTTCTPEEYTIEWSVNGEVTETTTVVEGDALVLPEAPAAPDACSEKVFMGWATTATVNAYGTEITFVDETTVPEGDATYYAVFATEIEEETNETYTKTATVSIADYAAANSWGNDTQYTQVIIDKNITATAATATGTGNTGKYYNSGYNWRFYQTDEDATLTINAAEGVTINNVTVTYASSNSGVLTFNSNNIQSGDNVEVNAPSVTFGVGNTGTATNGQVRVTQISVNYTFSGTVTSTTYADYSTICVVPEYTITFDYNKDAGYVLVNGERIATDEVVYKEGTELTVKALTFNDYSFNAWEDEDENELSTEPTYTFTVTKDVVLKAIITYEQGAVGTGVENNNVVSSKTMKVIQNGRLMIIREGKTYNAQGQMIE